MDIRMGSGGKSQQTEIHRVNREAHLEKLVGRVVYTTMGPALYKGEIDRAGTREHIFLYRIKEDRIGMGEVDKGRATFSPEGQINLSYVESIEGRDMQSIAYCLLDANLKEVNL